MNNKGFTLIELLAVIAILAIVLIIGGFSVTNYLTNSRQKAHEILIENIKIAAQNYYEECRYAKTANIECTWDSPTKSIVGGDQFPLSRLKKYGFLTTNEENITDSGITTYVIKDPLNNNDTGIQGCEIKITYDTATKKYTFEAEKKDGCPTNAEYNNTTGE